MKYEIKTHSGGPLKKKDHYQDKRTTGSASL